MRVLTFWNNHECALQIEMNVRMMISMTAIPMLYVPTLMDPIYVAAWEATWATARIVQVFLLFFLSCSFFLALFVCFSCTRRHSPFRYHCRTILHPLLLVQVVANGSRSTILVLRLNRIVYYFSFVHCLFSILWSKRVLLWKQWVTWVHL